MSERTERILWPVVAAVLVALVAAFPLTNTDIWWHLAGGRYIVEHGLPDTDPFSLSARGVEWVDIHWLFQVAAYAVWSAGGVLALVVAKMLASAAGAALLVVVTPRARAGTVLVLALSLFAVRHLLMARPIVVSMVLLAAFFLVLEGYRRGGGWRVLVVLPFLQIVWVNTQGLHALGPVLVASALAGTMLHRLLERGWPVDWRPLAVTLVACGLASFASPYGIGAALLPWKLFGRIDPELANIYAVNVSEFVPPWQLERSAPGSMLHLSLFLGAMALALVVARRRLIWFHVVLIVAFTGLAMMANRNILLLYWLGAPILAGALARGLTAVRLPRGLVAGAVACVALALVATREGDLSRPAPFRVPELAAEQLAGEGGGNVFCSVRYGGYLAWRLYPEWTPYIDGRLVLRTREQFAEYLEVVDDPRQFDDFADRNDFAAVVLPTAYPDRYRSLAAYLIEHPDWHLVFTDGTEVLFDRSGPGFDLSNFDDLEGILDGIHERHSIDVADTTRINLARLLIELRLPAQARRALDGIPPPAPRAEALLGRLYYLEGDLDLAETQAHRLLDIDDDDTDSLLLLALIAIDRGQNRQALQHLRRVLSLDPYDARARELVRRLEEAR